MKLYKVFFSTENDVSPFGEIPDIIKKAELVKLPFTFKSGGWDNDEFICYHEWESIDDTDIVKNFIETQYRPSLISFHIENLTQENDTELHQNISSDSK